MTTNLTQSATHIIVEFPDTVYDDSLVEDLRYELTDKDVHVGDLVRVCIEHLHKEVQTLDEYVPFGYITHNDKRMEMDDVLSDIPECTTNSFKYRIVSSVFLSMMYPQYVMSVDDIHDMFLDFSTEMMIDIKACTDFDELLVKWLDHKQNTKDAVVAMDVQLQWMEYNKTPLEIDEAIDICISGYICDSYVDMLADMLLKNSYSRDFARTKLSKQVV